MGCVSCPLAGKAREGEMGDGTKRDSVSVGRSVGRRVTPLSRSTEIVQPQLKRWRMDMVSSIDCRSVSLSLSRQSSAPGEEGESNSLPVIFTPPPVVGEGNRRLPPLHRWISYSSGNRLAQIAYIYLRVLTDASQLN